MDYQVRDIRIGWRSRVRVWVLRWFFRPLVARLARAAPERMARLQARAAGELPAQCVGLPVRYAILGGAPAAVIGNSARTDGTAILYLHGGGFVFPAVPRMQHELLARLCVALDAVGVMVDYRLAPWHPFPAALDDCERVYRALLDAGFAASSIVVAGESAGGNLVLTLLLRIRAAGLPMPACAVPISPVTELGRVHAPPSRVSNAARDALLSPALFIAANAGYLAGQDASNPEISPLYADYTGLPPMYFIASDCEMLRDDSVLAARQARDAGVEVELDVWPVLPHAFPIFGTMFAEVALARDAIVAFIRRHLPD